ncbi:MAG: peptide ABC transporter substrate-binding protein [Tissierellia bacterium]|nr:peptide ABC transporter substrate-binding protein [Tissierellia bacterium]
MKKKSLSLLIALLLLLTSVLAGCGGTNEAPPAEDAEKPAEEATQEDATGNQEITFVLSNEPDGLDPSVTNNSFASPFLLNLFEGLVSTNENGELIPGIAESWEPSDDGLTYTFHLRPDLKWSDGTPFTSKDFVYTFNRILKPETTAQYVDFLTDYIKGAKEIFEGGSGELGVETPDDNTLVFHLIKPAPYFVNMLGMWVYFPVQEKTVEENIDQWTLKPETYVSNGPFKVAEMKLGESVTLVKNENYWNAEKVKVEKIVFRYIKDEATALTAFESGEVDGIRSIPNADIPRLKAESNEYYSIPSFATTYYLINNNKAPYDNPKVREALNLAIDRQSLIDNVLQGNAVVANALVSPGYAVDGKDFVDGRSDFGILPNGDVEKAKQLLAEAGYPNGEGFPTMQLSYYSNPQVKILVESLAQMFKQNLGINVEISTEEWAVYYDNVKAFNYEVAAMGWSADYANPMTFLPLFKTGDANNISGYSNPEYDALVEKAQAQTDAAEAMKTMQEAEALLMKDYPFLPLYHRSNSLMMKDCVKGWYMDSLGFLRFVNAEKVQ